MTGDTAFITGSAGFVGRYVAAALVREGWTVWALSRSGASPDGTRSVRADLTDSEAIRSALQETRPNVILHLAAQSSVPTSFRDPVRTIENNVIGAANLFYAAAELEHSPLLLSVGSAEEYGGVMPDDLPITEGHPLTPKSPYGASKAAQSLLAQSLYRSHQLRTIVLRPFNHTGPGQEPRFAVPSFSRQLARIEAGLDEPVIRVGNLDAKRDYADVRDVARAYLLAMRSAKAGEVYNLGSGRSVSMRWILDELIARSTAQIRVEPDPARMLPADVPELRADPRKFQDATGWEPQIELTQTLQDTLDYWRARVVEEKHQIAEETTKA